MTRDLTSCGFGWANPSSSSALKVTVSGPHLLASPAPGTPGGGERLDLGTFVFLLGDMLNSVRHVVVTSLGED